MHRDGHGSRCCLRIPWQLKPWLQALPRESYSGGSQTGTLRKHGAQHWRGGSWHFDLENAVTGSTKGWDCPVKYPNYAEVSMGHPGCKAIAYL